MSLLPLTKLALPMSTEASTARHDRLVDRVILVVDDDDDIRSSFELAVKAEGAEVRSASDGNMAISETHDGEVDAVILDMMLPKRSGFLVLEKLSEMDDPPVVIMVTANQGRRHKLYAESLGVHAYLNKPVALQRLVDTLVELLERDDELRGGDES